MISLIPIAIDIAIIFKVKQPQLDLKLIQIYYDFNDKMRS